MVAVSVTGQQCSRPVNSPMSFKTPSDFPIKGFISWVIKPVLVMSVIMGSVSACGTAVILSTFATDMQGAINFYENFAKE